MDAFALRSRPWEQKRSTGSLEEDFHDTTGGVRRKQPPEWSKWCPSLCYQIITEIHGTRFLFLMTGFIERETLIFKIHFATCLSQQI